MRQFEDFRLQEHARAGAEDRAEFDRRQKGDLPPAVARGIAWDNGARLFGLESPR